MGQDLVSREKNPFLKVESKPRTKTFLMSSAIFFLSKFSVQDFCCRLSLFIQYWFSLNKIVACPFGVVLFCFFIWCKFLLNLQLSSLLPYFPYFLLLAVSPICFAFTLARSKMQMQDHMLTLLRSRNRDSKV